MASGPLAAAPAIDPDATLHDPAAPEVGDAKGDVTIVAFLDHD